MSYDIQFRRMGLSAVFDLKGAEDALRQQVIGPKLDFPTRPNTSRKTDVLEVCWIGDNHWLLRGPIEREAELFEVLRPQAVPVDLSIVHVSDTLAFFEISGPDAPDIMAIACPMDLSAAAFPDNGVSYSDVFGMKGLIARRTQGFEVAVERSFADMMRDCLCRASGTQPV